MNSSTSKNWKIVTPYLYFNKKFFLTSQPKKSQYNFPAIRAPWKFTCKGGFTMPVHSARINVIRTIHIFSLTILFFVFFTAFHIVSVAQTPLKTISGEQGGKIIYGYVDGATTQAQAMGNLLRQIHTNCGERPNVGNLFKLKNSDSIAAFFTVTNHNAGNIQIAGLLIAAKAGPSNIEVALVSDDARRFNTTANPLIKQLFAVWNPAGIGSTQPQTSSPSGNASGKSGNSGYNSGPVPKLHTVTAPDNSVSVGIPDGWQVDQRSGGGMIIVTGPNNEIVGLNLTRTAIDTNNRQNQMALRRGFKMKGVIYFPYSTNLSQNFTNIFQLWREAGGQPPAQFKIDSIDNMPAPQGNHCVHAKGQMNPDGKGMRALNTLMCITEASPQNGFYTVMMNHSLTPLDRVDADHNTIVAIVGSLQFNQQVLKAQADDATRAAEIQTQTAINNIHQIGAQATARYNATQAANEQQHASYWAQQDENARRSTTFENYQLDQTVIQDNNMYNNGTIGHGTVWNSTADALIKADPDRFEVVNQPNYWKGIDY
jgi:hypothetical protein